MMNKVQKQKKKRKFKKAMEGPTVLLITIAIGTILVIGVFLFGKSSTARLEQQSTSINGNLTQEVGKLKN